MPLYDYKCTQCDELFEKQVKLANSDDTQECPYCAGSETTKMVTKAAFGDSFRMGMIRPPNGWIDRLKTIDANTPGSKLKDNSRYL